MCARSVPAEQQPWQTQLPEELIVRISQHLWYNEIGPDSIQRRAPLGTSLGSQFSLLANRGLSALHVCRIWRRALYGEYSKYVLGDCQIGSTARRLPFLSSHYTKEVWLRFDGALLFGSWVIEWARCTLGEQTRQLSVESLILIVVESPNVLTTMTEDARASMLVQTCQQSVAPRSIRFLSQSSVAQAPFDAERFGIGDKFTRLFNHFAQSPSPPSLVSIDTRRIDHGSLVFLIARNADSLAYLRIGSVRPSELQRLVTGTAGDLVFHGLRELLLTLNLDDSRLKEFSFTRPHFPNLEFLHVAIPASDISPQRETSLTIFEHSFLTELFFHSPTRLRVANFPLAWDTVEILTPEMLSSVQELLLYEISMENEHTLDNEESNQMLSTALSLPHLHTAYLNNSTETTILPGVILCSRLQTLSIPLYTLTTRQIAMLADRLPVLSALNCQLSPDPDSDDIVLVQPFSPHFSMKSLVVRTPPSAHESAVNSLLTLIAYFPLLQHAGLPANLCLRLWERLRSDSETQRHRWSARLFATVQMHAIHAQPDPTNPLDT
ncbi:hypothetical protein GQ54DRAFT_33194 [Martensiomyces pterosporus]|nr:hypothetical protein GQ54DRAFT_33194 [Martensiomyces pterosporus]